MLCSIIIPLYNKAHFIEEALQSIFNQTYQNFEIIVVDDGSKDDGAARVRAIQDSRITVIQQPNGGVSKARNLGVDYAQGDLVCFLDADDWYLPQYLDTIVGLAKKYPDQLFFATYYKRVNLKENPIKFWDISEDSQSVEIIDDIFTYWRHRILFNIDSFAVRRSFLLSFQPCFPIGEQMGEDQDLYFRMIEKSSLVYSSVALTGYRMNVSDSLCAVYQGEVLFPAYIRLEQRALNRQLPDRLRVSALRLVAEARITAARQSLIVSTRWEGVHQLLLARRGMWSRRWWVTLGMCVVATPALVKRWESWRRRRAGLPALN